MSRSKKSRTEDEICVHSGRNGCIFAIPVTIILAIIVVFLPFIGFWWVSLVALFPLVLSILFIYHAWGETMTVNDSGIHWNLPRHKDLNVSIPWEDVIEIYQVFSLRGNITYVRFRNGPDVFRDKESEEETYRILFAMSDPKKMNKILEKHGHSIQLRAPKWMK